MDIIAAILGVLGAAAGIVIVSGLEMNGWLTAAIIVPLVLLAVYSMARVQPGKEAPQKEPAAEPAEA